MRRISAGIGGMGDIRRLGRIGAKTLGLYIGTSLLAIITGLLMVNLIRPGVGHLHRPASRGH